MSFLDLEELQEEGEQEQIDYLKEDSLYEEELGQIRSRGLTTEEMLQGVEEIYMPFLSEENGNGKSI